MDSDDEHNRDLARIMPLARSYLMVSRICEANLGIEIFHASWSIMVEVFISEVEQRPLSASKLGLASGLPAATTYRHLAKLIESGKAHCRPDHTDRRRLWVGLSPEASSTMTSFFSALSQITERQVSLSPDTLQHD